MGLEPPVALTSAATGAVAKPLPASMVVVEWVLKLFTALIPGLLLGYVCVIPPLVVLTAYENIVDWSLPARCIVVT